MVISLSQSALIDPNQKYNFRTETLWALKSLLIPEHDLVFDGVLSDAQQELLDQEGIHFSEIAVSDLSIEGENEGLQVKDGETILFEADSWKQLIQFIQYPPRTGKRVRKTKETEINIEVNLDGSGESEISTGLNFFDHMLEQIARHGLIDLKIDCKGDLEIDEHHTIEDVAITLGETITEALGEKLGIERYGFVLAMDESRAIIGLDLSGRPYLVFEGTFNREYVGDMPTEMVKHFFYSLAMNLKATLNIEVEGENEHHKIEACFKGFAKALKSAIEKNPRRLNKLPSSKGLL